MRWLLMVAIVSCAPTVGGPRERQQARDAADAAALSTQLAALPNVLAAYATLHHPADDPFAPSPPAGGSVLLVVDGGADQPHLRRDAAALAHLAETDIVVAIGAPRVELASVGPFTVEASSKRRLEYALAALLLGLAGASAYAARRLAR